MQNKKKKKSKKKKKKQIKKNADKNFKFKTLIT